MTDPIRTALRDMEAFRKDQGWPTPGWMRDTADHLDGLMRGAKYGDVLRWVADLCDAALATPPASPVIRHGDEHDDPDGYCATCKSLGIGPYAPAAPEPERCAECGHEAHGPAPLGCETVVGEDMDGEERLCPCTTPAPPTSAEALRDLTFEQAATKALAIAFHRAEGRCRGHYAPRCGEECDRFAERVGPTLAVWLGWYGIAAARATPPLTVEALAKAMESLSIHGRLYVTSAPLDTEYEWDEAAAAILAALEQDR